MDEIIKKVNDDFNFQIWRNFYVDLSDDKIKLLIEFEETNFLIYKKNKVYSKENIIIPVENN